MALSFIVFFIILLALSFAIVMAYLHELARPNLNLRKLLKLGLSQSLRVLFVYPHPDDESMSSAGLITKLLKEQNTEVKVISITPGEKGDELLKLPPDKLAQVRRQEFSAVMNHLGVSKFEVWDFPDGGVAEMHLAVTQQLRNELESFQPQVVVTFERCGIYGHPDHVELSKIVTELRQEYFPRILVLYATHSRRILSMLPLPLHMAKDKSKVQQAPAEYKLPLGSAIFKKFKAAKLYKSQYVLRIKPKQLFLIYSLYEYYTTKYSEN